MPQSQQISARAFAEDVRSSMTDAQLMAKYHLTPQRLDFLLAKLLEMKAITAQELERRRTALEESPNHEANQTRLAFRHAVDFVLPIYEAKDPEKLGVVLDLTDSGVGIRGIEARAGEIKTFVIPADDFFDLGRVSFQAVCRWTKQDTPEGEFISGFELVSISKTDLGEIRKLIKLVDEVSTIETIEYVDVSIGTQESPAGGVTDKLPKKPEYIIHNVKPSDRREQSRQMPQSRMSILEAANRTNKGVVLNISEAGIGTEGLESDVGDRRSLVIPSYGSSTFDSIVLVAECRWTHRDPSDKKVFSGFKIVQCTPKNANELAKLLVTLMTK